MPWYVYLRDFVACMAAVLCYGIIISVPRKPLFYGACGGALSYLVYRLIHTLSGHEMIGYLVGTLVAAVGAELLARRCKMPVTIFVLPGIIPLVPGVGLYRSMLCLIRNDISGFLHEGVRTLFISGIIAVTVAVINALARNLLAGSANGHSRFLSMRE